MIELTIESIRVSMLNYQRVVILKEKDGERYLATIGTSGDEWPPGLYTVFFHNWGYYDIGIETTSASVAYYW